jgi:23S rRNA (guanine745-N1)-methyltransferase
MAPPPALAHAAPLLRCPACAAPLRAEGSRLACAAGHHVDVARQGHVTLTTGRPRAAPGDTAAMVAARAAFLARGHYAPIRRAVAAAVAAAASPPGAVLDVGAGTGDVLAAVLDALPGRDGIALDLSPYAARRAARSHPRAAAVVCDAWGALPVADGVAGVAISCFAPRPGEELTRTLVPDGVLVVVRPAPGHLRELVDALGLLAVGAGKAADVARRLGPALPLEGEAPLRASLTLGHDAVAELVAMGPSAHHLEPAALAAGIAALPDPATVTVDVVVAVHRRR